MVGWHHRLNGQEFEQAPGVGDEQGNLACCSPWGHKESDTAEQLNWAVQMELLLNCIYLEGVGGWEREHHCQREPVLISHLALDICTFTPRTKSIPLPFSQTKPSSLRRKKSHRFCLKSHSVPSTQEVIFTIWNIFGLRQEDGFSCLKAWNEDFTPSTILKVLLLPQIDLFPLLLKPQIVKSAVFFTHSYTGSVIAS